MIFVIDCFYTVVFLSHKENIQGQLPQLKKKTTRKILFYWLKKREREREIRGQWVSAQFYSFFFHTSSRKETISSLPNPVQISTCYFLYCQFSMPVANTEEVSLKKRSKHFGGTLNIDVLSETLQKKCNSGDKMVSRRHTFPI